MTACEQIQDELSAYLDGELSSPERAAIDAHLKGCAACQAVLADLKSVQNTLADVPNLAPPPALAQSVRSQIANATAGSSREETSPRSNVIYPPVLWQKRVFGTPALVGIAALLMIGVLVFAVLPRLDQNRDGRNVATKADRAPAGTRVPAAAEDAELSEEKVQIQKAAEAESEAEGLDKDAAKFKRADDTPLNRGGENKLKSDAPAGFGAGEGKPGAPLADDPGAPRLNLKQDRIRERSAAPAPSAAPKAAAPQKHSEKASAPRAEPPGAAAPPAVTAAPARDESRDGAYRNTESQNRAPARVLEQREEARKALPARPDELKESKARETAKKEAEPAPEPSGRLRGTVSKDAAQAGGAADRGGGAAQPRTPQPDSKPAPRPESNAAKAQYDKAPAQEQEGGLQQKQDDAIGAAKGNLEDRAVADETQQRRKSGGDANKELESGRRAENRGPAEKKDGETAPAFTEIREFGDALIVQPNAKEDTKQELLEGLERRNGASGAARTGSPAAATAKQPDEPVVIRASRAAAEALLEELAKKFEAELASADKDADLAKQLQRALARERLDAGAEKRVAEVESQKGWRLSVPAAKKDAFIAELRQRVMALEEKLRDGVDNRERDSGVGGKDAAAEAEQAKPLGKVAANESQQGGQAAEKDLQKNADYAEVLVILDVPQADSAAPVPDSKDAQK